MHRYAPTYMINIECITILYNIARHKITFFYIRSHHVTLCHTKLYYSTYHITNSTHRRLNITY